MLTTGFAARGRYFIVLKKLKRVALLAAAHEFGVNWAALAYLRLGFGVLSGCCYLSNYLSNFKWNNSKCTD